MQKEILYLDQNFVSNLAKVEYSPGWKHSSGAYYAGLLALLRPNIHNNRLACPTSYFHREESEQSDRVRGIVWQLVDELSRGLSFNLSTVVHFNQIAAAALKYGGHPPTSLPEWSMAFNQDPQKQLTSRLLPPRPLVWIGIVCPSNS